MEMQDIYDVPKQSKDGINGSYDDITTVESMKRDLKKIKWLLLSLGLLLAILLTVSLIAAAIAALAYSKPTGSQVSESNVRNIASGELLRILNETAPDQEEKINLLQQMFLQNLSFQLEKLYAFQTNLSSINEQVGAMKGRLDGLDLLLNTDLDSVREELVSLSNITEITSTRREIADLRSEISELCTTLNGDTSSLTVRLNALDSRLTTNFTTLTNQISSLQLSSNRDITSAMDDIATVRRDVSNLQTSVESTGNSINSVTTQISTLSSTQSRDTSSLSNRITNLQQQTSTSINTVTGQINTLRDTHTSDNRSLTNRFSSLQSTTTSLSGSISTINTRLSRSVNIYQGCYEITRSCTISASAGVNGAEHIKPFCQTTYIDINYSVSSIITP
jgi:predicted  nucleic acid-binding Zn-ribbon protein